MSGSPVKTIGGEVRKSKERTEMSQSSAVTLKKIFPASGERKSPDWKMEELSKGRKTLKADIRSSQVKRTSLFHLKLKGVQSQQQDPFSGLTKQIEVVSSSLTARDDQIVLTTGRNQKALVSMELATRDNPKQLEIHLVEKMPRPMSVLRGSSWNEKLGQLEALEKKMEEQLKAEIKNSLGATEMLLDEKLGSVQTQLEARLQNPLSGLETQIKQLTNQLSSTDQKVSQEIEKKLQPIHSMQFASRDDLKQWKDLLEKKLSTSQPTLEMSYLEEKLEQLEKSEKKMEEQLKAEIKNSLGATEMLLDEKLGSVQTQLEFPRK
ncbi:uncharacterized protein LOC120388845 [Mauremys reevesii]|uniref:uncharacterized protein LOC120388845 n=1 Tax=Mauremys reevesii TaxID=260615 RepID=UPI00193FF00E|nr:uncharacterized protein LOC120388845 [Mauremys reevesii]